MGWGFHLSKRIIEDHHGDDWAEELRAAGAVWDGLQDFNSILNSRRLEAAEHVVVCPPSATMDYGKM